MNNKYIIFTDSACDLSDGILKEWGVPYCSLTFRFDGESREYSNGEMSSGEFYGKMKSGSIAKTSAVNTETFKVEFEKLLLQGYDILYLGFSGGLSTTPNSAKKAAQELAPKFPDRKIIAIDTLSGSAGQALIIKLALDNRDNGYSIEENAEFVDGIKLKICHWVTVDDLVYLKRGGRISPTVAFVGNILGVKPIIYLDEEGHLISHSNVRGKKKSYETLVGKYGELAENPASSSIFISHSDNKEGAEEIAKMLNEKYGANVSLITDIGPVIGAHTGPGTIALFFIGKSRK